MDIFKLLKKDHRAVDKLFSEVEEAVEQEDDERCDRAFEELTNELLAHAHCEQSTFYEPLESREGMREIVAEAKQEHAIVENLLKELDEADLEEEVWMGKFTVLRDSVQHHVKEEEKELFKHARAVLEKGEAQEIGERFEREKARHSALETA